MAAESEPLPALQGAALPPPLDLSHHFSHVTKKREASSIKGLYKYFQIPGIRNLAGGETRFLWTFVMWLTQQAFRTSHTFPMTRSKPQLHTRIASNRRPSLQSIPRTTSSRLRTM